MGRVADEHRRSAMFYKEAHDHSERIGGLMMVALGAAIVPALSWASAHGLAAIKPAYEDALVQEEPETIEVMEARFVRLGQELDPRRLPDKYIPSKATAPPAPVEPEPTPAPEPEAPPPTPEPKPSTEPPSPAGRADRKPSKQPKEPTEDETPSISPQAAEDLITRLGDSADAIAELNKPRRREGDPMGIPEGTETKETGDLYLGQLYSFFRRGWTVPTSISDADLNKLSCVVEVTLTADARVGNYKILKGSGNADFDLSVKRRLDQTVGAALPKPPADTAERYLGKKVSLRFLGKHGR